MGIEIPVVFPVVTKEANVWVYQSHGTAFFINSEGLFVTAAHTFNHPFRNYYALINGEFYEISKIWGEYTDFDYQLPPIYRDLFIGKILNLNTPNYYQLSDAASRLQRGTVLSLKGFRQEQAKAAENEKAVIDIDSLYQALEESETGLLSEEEKKAILLHFEPIEVSYQRLEFKHIDKFSKLDEEFTNGFSIFMNVTEPHGHSGGPLLHQGKVLGMLIGENAAISSEYIQQKVDAFVKPGNPVAKNRPEMAVEETIENAWLTRMLESVHEKLDVPGSRYAEQWQNLCFVSSDDLGLLEIEVYGSVLSGFAGNQSNYKMTNPVRFVHLIVINTAICKKEKISVPELEAIILHEIGHILNRYEHLPVPSEMDAFRSGKPYDKALTARIKYENRLNEECYADDYARSHGYVLEVIGSLEKYLISDHPENVEMINQRIATLKDIRQVLAGDIKPLRPLPTF